MRVFLNAKAYHIILYSHVHILQIILNVDV
jgi:hypothetical protein